MGISRRMCLLCERSCCALASTFPRIGVNMLTIWGIHTHLFSLCLNFYESYTRIVFIVIGTLFYVLATWSYIETVRVGAGSPIEIPGFAVRLSDLEAGHRTAPPNVELNVTAKENGLMRYCSKCECWKPDRTHHCSSCRRCILRMDHHCPWFATCIGFHNQKFFLQFLTYVSLFCLTCCCSSGYAVYVFLYQLNAQSQVFLPLNWVALLVVSFVMGFAVTCFAGYSLYLAAGNRTVLESLESVRYKTSLPSRAYRYREAPSSSSLGNIFDLGWRANISQVMGNQTWEWFIPIKPSVGDGTSFPVNKALYQQAQEQAQAEQQMLEHQYNYRQSQMKQLANEVGDQYDHDDLDYYAGRPAESVPLTRF